MGECYEIQPPKPTKRQWTAQEDAALMESLLQLVENNHWKADAGTFKPGYAKELEKYIHEKIQNCTLKASPHIESRVKHLKTQYSAIKDMLGPNASGFGWDSTRKMIVVEKEFYREWCKSHRTAIGLYGKPFPHFDALDFIYGKDKATGANAENPADAAIAMEREFYQTISEDEGGVNLGADENLFESQTQETLIYGTSQATKPTSQSHGGGSTSKGGKRGGKRTKYNDDASDSIRASLKELSSFNERTTKNIEQLISCFLHEKHTADKRNQVTAALKEIEELSVVDIVKAAILITNTNNLCDLFFTMDTPELRKGFVYVVLANNGAGV